AGLRREGVPRLVEQGARLFRRAWERRHGDGPVERHGKAWRKRIGVRQGEALPAHKDLELLSVREAAEEASVFLRDAALASPQQARLRDQRRGGRPEALRRCQKKLLP